MTICQVIKMLVKRLAEKGMAEDEISLCINTLWDIFADQHVKSCQDLNLQMEACGWRDFELDEQTFKVASAVFTI
jgi:hypothetical protein